ncbi:MAG: four helix bundle protein [Terricaulis sp.]
MTGIRSYRDLVAWQRAMDLAASVYALTKHWPREELYGMTSQTRRAAVSVAANIAEGYGRDNLGSYLQFLRIAQGSLKELETHLLIAKRVGVAEDVEAILDAADQSRKSVGWAHPKADGVERMNPRCPLPIAYCLNG